MKRRPTAAVGNGDRQRRLIDPNVSTQHRNQHAFALLSRLIPLCLLVLGAAWLLSTMKSANAQFPRQNQFQPNQFSPPGGQPRNFAPQPATRQPLNVQANQNFAASQPDARIAAASPTIPSLENGTVEAADDNVNEDASSWSLSSLSDVEMPAFVDKITQGGWLMLPLAVCSLIVVALSFERLLALRRGRVIPRPFVRRFTECVEDGQLSYEEATEICADFDCPVSEVFRAAVRRWGRPMLEIEQAVMDAGDRVADRLRRFLRVFHAISNVAPLIGLLGTVLGMIQAFDVISSQESIGRPEMLASGISKALITTAGGLFVAIPAYLAYMYFSSKSEKLLGEIDKLCQRVIDSISAEGLENASSRSSRKRRAA